MAKNITLSIPEDVANQMDSMPEVNWSSVARTSITQYIELRKNPDMSALMEKLQKQKGEEYVAGRKKAEEIADKFGYRVLDVVLKKYWKDIEGIEEMEMRGIELEPWQVEPTREDALQKILIERNLVEKDVSAEFVKGLRDRLVEIERALPE